MTKAAIGAADCAGHRETFFDISGRTVTAIVHDHHVEIDATGVLVETGKRRIEPMPTVVGDDNRADVMPIPIALIYLVHADGPAGFP